MDDPKQYLVLGATSDLAKAFVLSVESGANFTLVARNEDKLKEIYGSFNSVVRTETCDLKSNNEVKDLVGGLKTDKLKYDGVLCAVGAHEIMPLRLYSDEKFRDMVDANFFSVANILRFMSPILMPESSVVVISSAVTFRGAGTVSAYAASKSAVEGLVRAAALEYAAKKIRINAIAPGVFKSKMSDKFISSFNPQQLERLELNHPLGIGTPDQVASVIEFLLSPKSSWITGQTLIVDGGFSINA